MNTNKTITPIAILGYCDEAGGNMAAMLLNKTQDVGFTAEMVAGGLVSLYESFLNHVPENRQIEFEQKFKESFAIFFDSKAEYMTRIDDVQQPTDQ